MNESAAGSVDAVLLIDWENIKSSLSSKDMRPSVAAIRDACSRFGRIVLARAYADWQDNWLRQDPRDLYAGGIEPVYVPTRRYDEADGSTTIKNSVDVRLATDCIELIHTHPGIEVFILATGDSDFIHVVNKLLPYGKRVAGSPCLGPPLLDSPKSLTSLCCTTATSSRPRATPSHLTPAGGACACGAAARGRDDRSGGGPRRRRGDQSGERHPTCG